MSYFEEIDTRLYFCSQKMPPSSPWAASELSPHPTIGTPNLSHLLVIRLCITMYGYLLLFITMFMYDYVWLFVTMFDYEWLCMTMCDSVWSYMTMYDYLWHDYVRPWKRKFGEREREKAILNFILLLLTFSNY